MVTVEAFRKLALALPDTVEAPHFESASFRIRGKIFATLLESPGRATVKLIPEQQEMLTSAEPKIFQRIPNTWGDKGWTWIYLKAADQKTAESALKTAHANVSAKPRSRARKVGGRRRA